ncbi:MAG TPA: YdcF family protein [Promicromonospora sp.]|nr:YdcF family protein [Promicromonospora sp.]
MSRPDPPRRTVSVLWVALGAVLVVDALVMLRVTALHTGIVATFVLGLLYLAHGLSRRRVRWLRILVPAGTALLVALSAALAVVGSRGTATGEEDAVVVLGTLVKDGEPTPALRARLDVAAAYATAHPDALVVVAGGLAPGQDVTEARAMQRYLVARGVAEDRILRDDTSTSTSENFAHAQVLLDARLAPGYTTAFVTNEYHVARAAGIAAVTGVDATHVHAPTPWYEVPVDYVRETLALAKFALLRR